MGQKSVPVKEPAEQVVKAIRRAALGGVAQCLEGAPDLRGIEHLCRSSEFLNSPINVLSWRRSRRTRSP
jgi:hypothetical protein